MSASMRCVVTLLNDRKIIVMGGHTSQNSYHNLQAPSTFIGIGRSNNFIEEFSIAVYSGATGKRSLRTWTPVIPKSVLFVSLEMSENPDSWGLTLLLNPTGKIPLILLCDGVFLLVLGLVIIVFHLYEKVSAFHSYANIPLLIDNRRRTTKRNKASKHTPSSETCSTLIRFQQP